MFATLALLRFDGSSEAEYALAAIRRFSTIGTAAGTRPVSPWSSFHWDCSPAAHKCHRHAGFEATISGVPSFSGWAIDTNSPINSILNYIDGTLNGEVYYGVNRTDVCAAFPNVNGWPAANVGWTYSFDSRSLSNGNHTLQVESFSSSGVRQILTQHFTGSN